jgi:hypothetical protein
MRPDRPPVWVACVAAGAALVTFGIVLGVDRGAPAQTAHAVPTVSFGRVPSSSSSAGAKATRATRQPATLPLGSRLLIRGEAAPVRRVHIVGHDMQIPLDPREVGWWSAGAAPGSDAGTAVIVGHVNYAGVTGALAVLPRLRSGDAVTIAELRHRVRYRIVAVRTYPKTSGIPNQVFAKDGPSRLVLITCGGPFDASSGNYEDNIVAYARPVT